MLSAITTGLITVGGQTAAEYGMEDNVSFGQLSTIENQRENISRDANNNKANVENADARTNFFILPAVVSVATNTLDTITVWETYVNVITGILGLPTWFVSLITTGVTIWLVYKIAERWLL